jgi:putative ABC transport system permease protein
MTVGRGSLDAFMNNLSSALRQFRTAPGFSAVALITLALGIGANTAIFSVINGVLLRPLPYEEPDRLIRLYQRSANFPKASWAVGQFFSMEQDNKTFESVAAWSSSNFNLSADGSDPERIEGATVTRDFAKVLRLKPVRGRFFTPEEFVEGKDATIVISNGMWRQRFAGDPNILGRSLFISGRPREVIGVMPDEFTFPGKSQIWAPFAPNEANRTRRDLHSLQAFGRLKEGVTYEQAQADLKTLTARYAKEFAQTDADWSCVGFPMLDDAVTQIRPALNVLLASVVALLLIACANVTNLLLARAATRQRELSLRAALGGSRFQIARQLMIECLAYFVAGGVAGVLLGRLMLVSLLAIAPANVPRLDQVTIDLRVLLFTTGVTFLVGLIFGLIPAWTSSRTNITSALREGGHGSTGGRSLLRDGLVVVQVAATVVLLISSGLLIRSFHQLQQVDTGFAPEKVMTMKIDLPSAKYGTIGTTDEKRIQFVNDLVTRLQTAPGIVSVASVTSAPLTGGPTFIMRVESNTNVTPSSAPVTRYRTITPDYFKVMGIALLKGRFFTDEDNAEAPRRVIINRAFAKKYFPETDNPIGKRVEVGLDEPPNWAEVVGVVADVKIDSLEAETPVQAYEPYHVFSFNNITIVARTAGDPAALATAMRKEVLAIDPQQPVHTQKSMSQIVDDSLGQRYFALLLVGVFAAVALALASIGLYGVISYGVAQRTREFGVRLSIGASRKDITTMVLAQGSRLIGLGLAIGLVGALFSAQLVQSLLYGIGARDPFTFVFVVAALATVAIAACLAPALRASAVNPIVALRDQ